jgi:hypothetical protein
MGFHRRLGYPGYGIYHDFKNRLPYYKSDFVDAYNYRVIPSTIFVFFTNLLPAIAFAQDMFDATDNSYGLNEVLMSSAIGGCAFGLFAGQPLTITGVTGPIAIFSNTVYKLLKSRDTPYFPFMCWIYLWSMVFHFIIAIFNWVSWLKIISSFSCDAFGFFINFVYITKGIEILTRQFDLGRDSGYSSIMVALLMVLFGCGCYYFGNYCHLLTPWVRKGFTDYGLPICVIFFTGFIHFGGQLDSTHFATLPTGKSFQPTELVTRDGWFIHFWNISIGDVFLAIPFAILLTILFYFDHNVSALMCQTRDYPLKKPASFHWDFALLGLTTGISGLFGLPPPNGLIPQAPLHTHSLAVHDKYGNVISMVEQRVTNTTQGLITFVMMTKPFLVVLGLIPQAILSGLFFAMGFIGLHESIVTNRIRYILTEREYRRSDFPEIFEMVEKLQKFKWFIIYTSLEAIVGLAEYAITVTPGAIGFPVVLLGSMICAKWIWPLFIPKTELAILDASIVEPGIMESLVLSKKSGKPIVEVEEVNEVDLESNKDS